MRNISNSGNAIVTADAKSALVTCVDRNLPDRSRASTPVGSSVQIAHRGDWVGPYRVVGHSSSNIILGKGRKVFKRPRYKVRFILSHPEEGVGQVGSPSPPGCDGEIEASKALGVPKRYHGSRAVSPYDAPTRI